MTKFPRHETCLLACTTHIRLNVGTAVNCRLFARMRLIDVIGIFRFILRLLRPSHILKFIKLVEHNFPDVEQVEVSDYLNFS